METARFFEDITLNICRSLDIEKGMQACMAVIQKAMPADEIMLHFYDPDQDCIRLIARATRDAAVLENRPVPLPQDLDLVKEIRALPRTHVSSLPGKSLLNQKIMKAYGITDYSLAQMFLETREQKYGLGHLTLCAKGKNRYTPKDLELLVRVREPFTIATVNALHHLKILKDRDDLALENRSLKQELVPGQDTCLVGEATGLAKVMERAGQVATTQSIVLLTGETGVGKEMVANRIHALSGRQGHPMIKFNCGAVPDALVDSELFGHERGAFTGAVAVKQGKFERAHNGTLFLDEVGELSPTAQVRLLRVLQNGVIERVGGTRSIQTQVRIIAATNRDLEAMTADRGFRKDLWFRLNVFPIKIPPLRERKGDIPLLTHYFIREKSRELNLPMIPAAAPRTMDRLMAYDWPGNVRELKNIIERSLILNQGEDLAIDPIGISQAPIGSSLANVSGPLELNRVMADHIERVLEMTRGKIHGPDGAADRLGMNAGTLRHRMDRLGIIYGRRRQK